jgi:hypothetical protein
MLAQGYPLCLFNLNDDGFVNVNIKRPLDTVLFTSTFDGNLFKRTLDDFLWIHFNSKIKRAQG